MVYLKCSVNISNWSEREGKSNVHIIRCYGISNLEFHVVTLSNEVTLYTLTFAASKCFLEINTGHQSRFWMAPCAAAAAVDRQTQNLLCSGCLYRHASYCRRLLAYKTSFSNN